MFRTWGIDLGRTLHRFPKFCETWTIHSLCRQRYYCIGSSWGPRMYQLPSFLLSVTNDCSQGSDLLTFSNDVAGAYWTPDIIGNISTYPSKGAFFHFNKQAHSNKQVSAACSMNMHEPPWKPRIISLYWVGRNSKHRTFLSSKNPCFNQHAFHKFPRLSKALQSQLSGNTKRRPKSTAASRVAVNSKNWPEINEGIVGHFCVTKNGYWQKFMWIHHDSTFHHRELKEVFLFNLRMITICRITENCLITVDLNESLVILKFEGNHLLFILENVRNNMEIMEKLVNPGRSWMLIVGKNTNAFLQDVIHWVRMD